jgi:hypothetical protein
VVGLCITDDPDRSWNPLASAPPFNAPFEDDRYCARRSGEVMEEIVVSRFRGSGL